MSWLRPVTDDDVAVFYEQQLDPVANAMVTYDGKPPADRESYLAKWATHALDPTIVKRTILAPHDEVAGYVVSFERDGVSEVGYWIGRKHWGKGFATEGLRELLSIVKTRPLTARISKQNPASRRVVEKCGFVLRGEDAYSPVPGGPLVHEWILKLP